MTHRDPLSARSTASQQGVSHKYPRNEQRGTNLAPLTAAHAMCCLLSVRTMNTAITDCSVRSKAMLQWNGTRNEGIAVWQESGHRRCRGPKTVLVIAVIFHNNSCSKQRPLWAQFIANQWSILSQTGGGQHVLLPRVTIYCGIWCIAVVAFTLLHIISVRATVLNKS